MKKVTDPNFKYTPSAEMKSGYLKAKFDQIRRQQREEEKRLEESLTKVLRLRSK